jgi:hypothetical protein
MRSLSGSNPVSLIARIIVAVILVMTITTTNAQSKSANSSSYKTALGVKVWDGAGISFKHFLQGNNAVELIGYFWGHGFRITGLYEIHGPIQGATGLMWYIGPGAHIGFYDGHHHHHDHGDHDHHIHIGIDGVIGLDYKFKGAPINMSLDWQPAFEFGHGAGFYGSWGGLGIRYTF